MSVLLATLLPLLIGTVGGLANTAGNMAFNYFMQKDQQKFNAGQADISRNWASSENQATREFNSMEAQKARDWQEYMASTQYQRQVESMKAAGLNVGAIGSGGGLSTPTASTASMGGGTGAGTATSGLSNVNSSALASSIGQVLSNNSKEFASEYMANSAKDAKIISSMINKLGKSKYDYNANEVMGAATYGLDYLNRNQ